MGALGRRERLMRLHSDILTLADISAALPPYVCLGKYSNFASRSRQCGFDISLTGHGARHTRKKNSGNHGAGDEYAASWDDWGVWIAALYDIDPDMIAGHYKNRDMFYAQTAFYTPRGMSAPWLVKAVA